MGFPNANAYPIQKKGLKKKGYWKSIYLYITS